MSHQSSFPANLIKLNTYVPPPPYIAMTFPMQYLPVPIKAQELVSKVTPEEISITTQDYPLFVIKHSTANELRSKFAVPPPPPYQFIHTYGGAASEYAYGITPTADKCYIIVGHTYSFPYGTRPLLLIKINDYGEVIWARTIGGGGQEYARTIVSDPNGGYLIAGYTTSYGAGDRDLLLVHIDDEGDLDWVRVIGGIDTDELRGAFVTPDGGVIAFGYTYSFGSPTPQPIVVKLDSSLNIESAYVHNFSYSSYYWGVIPTLDGNYLAVGRDVFYVPPDQSGIVAKIDNTGDIIWARRMIGNDWINFLGAAQLSHNTYVLAGYAYAFKLTDADCFITKITEDGAVINTMMFGGDGFEEILRITLDSDGNIIGTGLTTSYPFDYFQTYICKITSNLRLKAFSLLNGTLISGQYEEARDVCVTHDKGYMYCGGGNRYGYGGADFLVVKVNRDCLIEDTPFFTPKTPNINYVSPYLETVYPTIIDVKDNLAISSPTYTVYTPTVITRKGAILRGWDAFVEEQH